MSTTLINKELYQGSIFLCAKRKNYYVLVEIGPKSGHKDRDKG